MTRSAPTAALRRKLETLYANYSREEYLTRDPAGALDRSLPWEDLELLSFILAGLSYGRVENIYRSYFALLERLQSLGISTGGRGLSEWLRQTPEQEQHRILSSTLRGWVHRLNSAEDLRSVLMALAHAQRKWGSLAVTFLEARQDAQTPKEALIGFCTRLDSCVPKSAANARRSSAAARWKGTGASWFWASPLQGSTCKRLVMWMRWMSRKDAIDLGLWAERYPEYPLKKELFWPVDTHIHKWAIGEGLTSRKSANWVFVEELTSWAQTLCPEDPARYDFVICQSGMLRFRRKL